MSDERDPTEGWELVRTKTEVVLHLRDDRLNDGHDVYEALDACLDALAGAFGRRWLNEALVNVAAGVEERRREADAAAWERKREELRASGVLVGCPECGAECKVGNGLKTHRRIKHGGKASR